MKNRILAYIKEHGKITTKQAYDELGCCDLQHYIMVLRQNHDIKDKWVKGLNRFGEKTEWKEYYLNEQNTDIIK